MGQRLKPPASQHQSCAFGNGDTAAVPVKRRRRAGGLLEDGGVWLSSLQACRSRGRETPANPHALDSLH
jgi:hypothetical protein